MDRPHLYLEEVDNSLSLVYGTYEEGKQWVGKLSPVSYCDNEVNWPMIKFYCALIEDANPCFWDRDYARQRFGDIIAPPGMLMIWSMPPQWVPSGERGYPLFATQIPLPGNTVINVSTETEFLRPIRIGEQLHVQEEVLEISEPKETKLGKGNFITTLSVYRNARGEVMAKNKNVIFRYTPFSTRDMR